MSQGGVGAELRESWEANAAAWTRAVRGGAIPSRRAGTDAAVVALCRRLLAEADAGREDGSRPTVLDVGCGEGWLARELAAAGADVLGIDGSQPLVEAAREAGGGACYEVASYERLVADGEVVAGPWSLVVCNFALLGDPLAPLLGALGRRLAPGGRLVVQTVHPWTAAGDGPYADGWRVERFDAFAERFPAPMPWYARTLGSWVAELRTGGLSLLALEEPLHPDGGRPLSLLLLCGRAAG